MKTFIYFYAIWSIRVRITLYPITIRWYERDPNYGVPSLKIYYSFDKKRHEFGIKLTKSNKQ